MSRLLLTTRTTRNALFQIPSRSFTLTHRTFAETSVKDKGAQNSRPGWEGRGGDDHVLHRDGTDVQSDSSLDARKQKDKGEEGSTAISQKDENKNAKKAKEENPEAPEPIIGMTGERGSKQA
ncbi:hypothetical protein H2198_002896 [Neophaeococcomyces mojaviensis]|uniref:Uncharacterized protein n=1 Tax=Neophaeococcomyces mojaviensis TaxID=3383035 RepID=A0ACC3ACT7_9EURO|nr:hypothetical protein H2198_002896 [Knufia sp. JES_112]